MTVACVTGASGFIGRALVRRLGELGEEVLPAHRGASAAGIGEWTRRSQAGLTRCLAGVDSVYHLAGLHEGSRHATAADLDAVNRDLTVRLFDAACAAGVRTFIWLSTVKVLGEVSQAPLGPSAPHAPASDYARSKARAEQALLARIPHQLPAADGRAFSGEREGVPLAERASAGSARGYPSQRASAGSEGVPLAESLQRGARGGTPRR